MRAAALAVTITLIVGVAAQPKMGRVQAGWIIAAMANAHTLRWVLAGTKKPREPRRRNAATVHRNLPVSPEVSFALPEPALVGAAHLDPTPVAHFGRNDRTGRIRLARLLGFRGLPRAPRAWTWRFWLPGALKITLFDRFHQKVVGEKPGEVNT
jgi:hypothetical protein